ncbi:SET domain-containing protein [Daedalea quercina L-15889]|uniref:SET domain-containing protein n=1 Tax=Daedalea quercina L-15889 TaxID=1314783 RepID=A0A165P2K5_9APHY|nr:SET domain-containing protein [Daedalea quercina L-15889]
MPAQSLRDLWDPSPPPPEDWELEEEAIRREWEYDRIVNEEIDVYGLKWYEVKWRDWHRNDATRTNTTWQRTLNDGNDGRAQKEWDRKRANDRAKKAKESPDVKVGIEAGQPWHEDATVEMQDAYEEKLAERRRRGPRDYANWDAIQHITQTVRDSSSDEGDRSRSIESTTLSHGRTSQRRLLRPGSQHHDPPPQSHPQKKRNPYKEIEARWLQATKRAHAAPVYIVPESSAQDVPPGLEDLEYCEQHYVRTEGVSPPLPDLLVGCDCQTGCKSAKRCDCQHESAVINEASERRFAYNKEGIFKFILPAGGVVIECNSVCTCPTTCQNRIAQQPRDVPMEVFYAGDHGWGVCTRVDLSVGKVLGVYTGKLIHRQDAEDLSDEHRSYIFDLDVQEMDHEDDSVQHYSVDSLHHGNWSRFINHSCDPNTKVYPVVWDTVIEQNQPYLAFVVTKNITAGMELTIDYNPREAIMQQMGKSKGKTRVPEGAKPCMCGTEKCRGWVMV